MDQFFEDVALRAATIDEILSDKFASGRGQKANADQAGLRLAAWCKASASGDWEQFARRLERDNLTVQFVLQRFASAQRCAPVDQWLHDAIWIDEALRDSSLGSDSAQPTLTEYAFEEWLRPIVAAAASVVEKSVPAQLLSRLASEDLRNALYTQLARLCGPALYDEFVEYRALPNHMRDDAGEKQSSKYDSFIQHLFAKGSRELFSKKPVLLRLIASLTRQWVESITELLLRLVADLETIRHVFIISRDAHVARIELGLGDRHNFGRSVCLLEFSDQKKSFINLAICGSMSSGVTSLKI